MKASLIATLTSPPDRNGLEVPAGVDILEIRGDLVPEVSADWLRDHFAGSLLFTLRSRTEGGEGEESCGARRRRLEAVAASFDLVDLELERDLSPELLAAIPAAKRVISWHGSAAAVEALEAKVAKAARAEFRWLKLVPAATCLQEAVSPLQLLGKVRRDDIIAFASGEAGVWSRLLAPRLGAPAVFGALGGRRGAPGQLPIPRLMQDFGLPALPQVERLYGIVGSPVSYSLSPRLHNGAYRELGLPALYLPFHAVSLPEFWRPVVEEGVLQELGLELGGLSVTAPLKAEVLRVTRNASPVAARVGAANSVVPVEGGWEADCTDVDGVVLPLRARGVELRGRRAAVVGCGGAGRAAAVGLVEAGAAVTLVNRSLEAGRRAAAALDLPLQRLAGFDASIFDLVVHATPLGRRADDPLPFAAGDLAPGAVVVDMVYGEAMTPLVAAVRAQGRRAVEGREVLLYQAVAQFRRMTGRELPLASSRRRLGLAEEGE